MLYHLLLLLDIRVLIVVLCAYFVTLAYVKSCRPPGFPPGPPTLPFIGNTNLLASNNQIHKTFLELGRKYGPMFSVQLGWHPAVVINDFKLLKDALVKKGNHCSDRFNHFFLLKLVGRYNLGVINSEGQIWKESRKLVVNSLRDFGVGKATIGVKVSAEAENILSEIEARVGTSFGFDLLFKKASANVIFAMVSGERYGYQDKEFIDFLRTMDTLMDIANIVFMPTLLIPYLLPIYLLKRTSAYKLLNKMIEMPKKCIAEHKEKFDPHNVKDFIDVFLDSAGHEPTNPVYTDQNCAQIIMNLFIAGTDTTSGTLNWTMLFMLRHPEIQDKCRQEILDVIGTDRRPCLSDRDTMAYVRATLWESLRIATVVYTAGHVFVVPHALCHSTAGEVMLNGYNLPKDTVIIPDVYSIHMNPDLWENPEEFRPERFINTDGTITKALHFIPFSIGRRSCPGEQLARTELFLFFTTMLQKFVFTSEDIEKLPTIHDGSFGITFRPAPYQVIATPV